MLAILTCSRPVQTSRMYLSPKLSTTRAAIPARVSVIAHPVAVALTPLQPWVRTIAGNGPPPEGRVRVPLTTADLPSTRVGMKGSQRCPGNVRLWKEIVPVVPCDNVASGGAAAQPTTKRATRAETVMILMVYLLRMGSANRTLAP